MTRMTIAASLLAMLAATGASASVDTSPKPGGVYRLKPGIYVARGADCRSPAMPISANMTAAGSAPHIPAPVARRC